MGNRIAKYVYNGSELESSTFYVRDAQGTTIAVYDEKLTTEELDGVNITTLKYALAERHIYGSSRLGMDTTEVVIPNSMSMTVVPTPETNGSRYLGKRLYELSNHLGNVLTVISDRKMALPLAGTSEVWYYRPHLVSVTDYSPFGVALTARTWSDQEYRFGFNGKELDKEGMGGGATTYDYGFRIYNAALGKFLCVDPLSSSYPWYSPYHFAGNTPIWCVDVDGLEPAIATFERYRILNWNGTNFENTNNSDLDLFLNGAQIWGTGQKFDGPDFGYKYDKNGRHDVEWFYCQFCSISNSEKGLWYWRVKETVSPIKPKAARFNVTLDYEIKASSFRLPVPPPPLPLPPPPPPAIPTPPSVNVPESLDFSAAMQWKVNEATLTDQGWLALGANIGLIQLQYWTNPDKFFMEIDLAVLMIDTSWDNLDEELGENATTEEGKISIFAGKPRYDLVNARIASISNYLIRNGIPATKFNITPRIDPKSLNSRIRTSTK